MNIDPILIAVASLGFIFGWFSGKRDQMKKVLHFICTLEFKGTSNSKDFEAGLNAGVYLLRETVSTALKNGQYITGINFNVKGEADREGKPKVDYKNNNKD